MSKSKILFMMSGSIAAFKACQVLSRLVQDGHDVQVAATPSTFEFIGRMTLEGLSGKPVASSLWESGKAMDHIHLTRWADFAILCPASANTIARLAHGQSDELVSAMALAWPVGKPFWVIPAMNHQMLAAAATRENLRTLQSRGLRVAATQSGSLACGEEGLGRMLEADDILKLLSGEQGRVLITAGATREPIDGIRFISNVSSGQTAASLSDQLAARGWRVTYLSGAGSIRSNNADKYVDYSSYSDLDQALRRELALEDYSAVIHCAAVSDFSVDGARTERKISSSQQLTLNLTPNAKLLPRLKEYSRNKGIKVVGFKLTLNADPLPEAQRLLGSEVDAVVANEWTSVAKDRNRHPGCLVAAHTQKPFNDLQELTNHLNEFFKGEAHGSLS